MDLASITASTIIRSNRPFILNTDRITFWELADCLPIFAVNSETFKMNTLTFPLPAALLVAYPPAQLFSAPHQKSAVFQSKEISICDLYRSMNLLQAASSWFDSQ
jgi:hypothetical protein